MAGPGRAARVATSVAIALAASCNPLVNANANAIPTAMTATALTDRVWYFRQPGALHGPEGVVSGW